MDMSINNALYNSALAGNSSSTKTTNLQQKLSTDLTDASDKELMDSCKDFEAYLLEQVFSKMKEALTDNEEEENDYTEAFGDMLYQKYAEDISENGQLGIAQQLYESMKRG